MVPVYCPLCCDQPFEDQPSLYFHLRGVRNNLFCPICSEKFASLEVLVTHLSKKCPGPESPLLAKRKCLAKINEEPTSLEKKPKLSPPLPLNVSGDTTDYNCDVKTPSYENEKVIPEVLSKNLPKNAVMMKSPDTSQLNTRARVISHVENVTSLKNSPIFVENPCPNVYVVKKKTPAKQQVLCVWDSNEAVEIQDSSVNTTALIPSMPFGGDAKPKATNSTAPWPQLKTRKLLVKNDQQKQAVPTRGVVKCSSAYVANQQLNLVASSGNSSGVKCSSSRITPPKSVPISPPKATKPLKKPLKPIQTVSPDTPEMSNSKDNVERARLSDESDFSFDTYDDNTTNDTASSKSGNESLEKSTTEVKTQESKKGKSLQNGTSFPKGKSKEATKKVQVDGKEKDVAKSATQQVKSQLNGKTETENAKDGKGDADDKNGSADEEYTCSACNIRFTSIYEHIKQYHNGEEVVVEIPEEELKEEVRAYQHGQESSNSKIKETIVVNGETPKDLNTSSSSKNEVSTNKSIPAPNKGPPNNSLIQNKTSKTPTQTNNRKLNGSKTQKPNSSNPESVTDKTVQPEKSQICPKVNRSKGKWVLTEKCGRRAYFQYLYNPNKNQLLMKEMKTNKTPHPLYGSTIQTLFENPKINVVEITYKPNTPYFTDRIVDLKNPIPMYVTERSVESEREEMLGGKASYIIANSIPACERTTVPNESKVIAVMKVILASDKKLTLENIVFKEKPVNEFMIPFLEDVKNPELPLLEGAKMLMWRCTKCMVPTWKFPLTKDSHCCFSCHICHQPLSGTQGLRAHMALHKSDLERLCSECYKGYASIAASNVSDLGRCARCGLFVRRETIHAHWSVHRREPTHRFTCSACESVFRGPDKVKVKQRQEQMKVVFEKPEQKKRVRLVAKHSCGECDKKFYSLTALAYHGLDHKPNSLQYPCNFCPKKFLRKKEKRPIKGEKRKPSVYIQKVWHEKFHTRSRTHRCSGCPKTFRSEWHFRQHAAAAHKYEVTTRPAPPIFACDRCVQTFSNEASLAAHTVSRHAA